MSTTTPVTAEQLLRMPENDELSGEEVVAGFRCRVAEIFSSL